MKENNILIPITRKISQFISKSEMTCQVFFVTKENKHDEVRVELQYMDLRIEDMSKIITQCINFVSQRENWDYQDYGNNRDETLIKKYLIEDMKHIPNTNVYLKETNDQVTELDEQFVNNLKSIQFRFTMQGKTVIFFGKFTKQKILSHKKSIWNAISGVLTLNKDEIVELPQDYDCCKYGNEMIIFHPDNFEDLFDYHEIHMEFHKEVFTHLENHADYVIEDIDKIKGQISKHSQKLRKLPAIKEKKMYLWSFKKIDEFLKKRQISSVEIDRKKKSIKFKDAYAMMHFYNDAHLDSKATETSYFTTSKSVE